MKEFEEKILAAITSVLIGSEVWPMRVFKAILPILKEMWSAAYAQGYNDCFEEEEM